jgi:hypothetical protein
MLRFLLLVFLTPILLFGQMQQTNGPFGGQFSQIAVNGSDLFAVTSQGQVFYHHEGVWQRTGKIGPIDDLVVFNDHLVARSTYDGLFVSADDGATWSEIFTSGSTAFFTTDTILYATVDDTIYQTSDGTDWQMAELNYIADTILFGEPTEQILTQITAFAIDDSIALLGCTTSVYPIPQGIYVTTDHGDNWTFPETIPDGTFAHTFVHFDGAYYLGEYYNGVKKSTDNGQTWSVVNTGIPEGFGVYQMQTDGEHLYCIANTANRELMRLDGDTWVNMGLSAQIFDFKVSGDDLFFLESNAIKHHNFTSGVTTDLTEGIIGTTVTPVPVNANSVFALASNATYFSSNGGDSWALVADRIFKNLVISGGQIIAVDETGVFTSTDDGASWTASGSSLPTADHRTHITSLVSNPAGVFIGVSKTRGRDHLPPVWEAGGVFKSQDDGQTWTEFTNGLPSQGAVKAPVSKIYQCDDHLIIRTIDGAFRRPADGSASWALFEDGLLEFTNHIRYAGFGNRIYSITTGGIYYSEFGQSQWQPLNTNLPFEPYSLAYFNLHFIVFEDAIALAHFDDLATPDLYVLEENQWVSKGHDLPAGVVLENFVALDNSLIYSGSVENGVWKGTVDFTLSLEDARPYAQRFNLAQNYPNPFNPTTTIAFELPFASRVKISIYNVKGQHLQTLADRHYSAGLNRLEFDARDLSSGVYFYRLEAGAYSVAKRMVLLK